MCNRPIVAAAAALLISGCALHPVPEDVTGVDTYHIVRQIRCETREAVKEVVLNELKRLATDHEDQPGDPIARRLLLRYESDPESISTFEPKLFPGPNY